ncbi:Holliday junction branch migration protein RuvA [Apibacter muscae]|uniref:Holliday junction branch migration complex subunit RuvA n=1 Tax=Apibacter muscae TaxID=2509004 RepID=A0A563DBL8_9FLAO|nr:Holliday junction branch migration protein RuvA [Apibacter muscae]TWP27323.1 Holliday junction branch migration protein RuvA [Apibacter muscae]TWP28544.1 Holliday junction branch migration protein RuvA [Apibacter muscae]
MITHLSGNVYELSPSSVVIDCNGVGYFATISLQTYTALQNQSKVHLYIQEIVREDAYLLYGFSTKAERELFNLLISVNGLGPASAIMMLSSMSSSEIASAISNGNNLALQKIKGIGAKTAQRIILDLRDKIIHLDYSDSLEKVSGNKTKIEALNALEVLGISKKISEKLMDKILDSNPDIDLEDLIKQTLKNL